jgi:hypothetical protein
MVTRELVSNLKLVFIIEKASTVYLAASRYNMASYLLTVLLDGLGNR